MSLIDTHAHLDHLNDLDEALEAAAAAGVAGIVAVSMDLDSCRKNLEIQRTKTALPIYLGLGMHPAQADENQAQGCLELIREHKNALTAVGEIGLDFWYKDVRKDEEKKERQRRVFRLFLAAARELNLPAVIHSRGAWRECLETAREMEIRKAVFHWYSGPWDVLDDILAQGYYVSATPSVAYSPQLREAVSRAPIERILLETDCPVYYKNRDTDEGFEARPKDVFKTLEACCALKGLAPEEAAGRFNANAREFFNIP